MMRDVLSEGDLISVSLQALQFSPLIKEDFECGKAGNVSKALMTLFYSLTFQHRLKFNPFLMMVLYLYTHEVKSMERLDSSAYT